MIFVDNTPMPWFEGMTLASLLKKLDHVEFCSVVRLNGKLISSPFFERTRIPENAQIELLPLVAGG
ncbi:MAG: sulfur carrier protein ThiS [Pseudomonadota bacterium]